MKQTPRPDSIDQLLDSIKQEYTNRGGSLGTEQNIKEHCRSFFEGQVFLSHTSKDHDFCKKYIVPVLDRFGLWSYFFMSVGGIANPAIATAYRFMVEYSLYYCKTIIFAVSEASVRSDWVRLEARWAVEQRHPRIVCLLDQTAPEDLHIELGQNCRGSLVKPPQRIIPFDKDLSTAQSVLNRLLHSPAFAHKKRAEAF